ncbi:unnamed protein product [Ostreobium quekettii]|uniref:3-dehydrosphinganine reductase n=1 Tax=Ostreobium quekettii TaxID=121088 RepID=A0A8S1JED6_9CHLO|nr:unnamed protein product [Ostreobium quekettii]|eukprot:evm.model.scf_556.3 EVM.evm.TU.scf_556.3   scf_556:32178-34771(+)
MFWRKKKSFAGKHVCITGGSEGLGLALAMEFVREAAHVTIISRSAAKLSAASEGLKRLAGELGSAGRIAHTSADVTDFGGVRDAVARVEAEGGPVDVLVCCAGACKLGHFTDLKADDFESAMRLNYMGTVNALQAALPRMETRDRGLVVIIASAMAVNGMACNSSYAPTKWALRGLADSLRMEYQGTGVGFCIAYPPDTATPGLEATLEGQEEGSEARQLMELGGETYSVEAVSKAIMKGLKRGDYHLPSPDFLQNLTVSSMSGLSPAPLWLPFQMLVSSILVPIYAVYLRKFDAIVRNARKRSKSKKDN